MAWQRFYYGVFFYYYFVLVVGGGGGHADQDDFVRPLLPDTRLSYSSPSLFRQHAVVEMKVICLYKYSVSECYSSVLFYHFFPVNLKVCTFLYKTAKQDKEPVLAVQVGTRHHNR